MKIIFNGARIALKGGPGSGFRGHRGREGEVGGSIPSLGMVTARARIAKLGLGKTRFTHEYTKDKLTNPRKPPKQGAFRSKLCDVKGDGTVILKYKEFHKYREARNDEETNTPVTGMQSDYRSDVEAYRIAEQMGFTSLVPRTERTRDPETNEKCAAMEFVKGNIKEVTHTKKFPNGSVEQYSQLAVLDTITGNRDRHGGNLLVDQDTGKIHAIDNSLAFHRTAVRHDPGLISAERHYRKATGKKDFMVSWVHIAAGDRLVNNPAWRKRIVQKFDQGALDRVDARWKEFKRIVTGSGWWNEAHESDMLHERGQV